MGAVTVERAERGTLTVERFVTGGSPNPDTSALGMDKTCSNAHLIPVLGRRQWGAKKASFWTNRADRVDN